MTFENDEVREKFHGLPAQQQFEWCELEVYLARQGKRVHIKEIVKIENHSEVLVRIDEKFQSSV
jgi:hypothetical protein